MLLSNVRSIYTPSLVFWHQRGTIQFAMRCPFYASQDMSMYLQIIGKYTKTQCAMDHGHGKCHPK